MPAPSSSAPNGGVSRTHDASTATKLGFATLHAVILGVCLWIAFGGLALPDPLRAQILAGCAGLYFLRHLVTLFVLLKRKVTWSEALGLAGFMAVFELGFLLLGGGLLREEPTPFGVRDALALGLVMLGSGLNTGSELQRWAWKAQPGTKGRCYTGGLFAYASHINYFGDAVLFTGWALLTYSVLAFAVPIFMIAGFVFVHIPALDAYLTDRYGDEFRAYAARTAKFIPWVY